MLDAFTFDGNEFWTVEDGGRIRHRDSTGSVHFQDVPDEVKDSLRRIHFVPDGTPEDGPTGWAVGETGWMIKTENGGTTWDVQPYCPSHWCDENPQWPAVIPQAGHPDKESLWDVHFLDENRGWVTGLHGIWRTVDGGINWTPCTIRMQDNHLLFDGTVQSAMLTEIEFYALDVVERAGPPVELVGMAAAQPGLVFKTTDGIDWKVVWPSGVRRTPGLSW